MGCSVRLMALLLAVMAVSSASGCSAGRRDVDDAGAGDADTSSTDAGQDARADGGGGDALPDGDGWVLPDSDIDSPEEVPSCGDGRLDEGEQCDDGNRLNGDGCDWLCRVGDGAPPPAPDPDPDAGEFVPEGDPVAVDASPDPETDHIIYLPLVWTGTALATAFQEVLSAGFPTQLQVRFRRFAPDGSTLYPEWTHQLRDNAYALGIDLVWAGDGFGFFFSDSEVGIYFLWLDEHMKPDGDPIQVVEAPRVGGLAADLTTDGFVLTWIVLTDREGMACHDPTRSGTIAETWVRLVGRDGSTEGLADPVLVDDHDDWHASPDVVSTADGFALVTFPAPTEDYIYCPARVLTLGGDLVTTATTGNLSPSSGGELIFDGSRTVVSWSHDDARRETSGSAVCTAGIAASGSLDGPPVCNVPPIGEPIEYLSATRFASDGYGFLQVFDGMVGGTMPRDARLWAMGSDLTGTLVGGAHSVASEVWGHAVERTDDGFGVLYVTGGEGRSADLVYQRFVRSE